MHLPSAVLTWPSIAVITLLYWLILFVRMRRRGRRDFDRAFEGAAAGKSPDASFDVVVPVEWRPFSSIALMLVVPLLLILLRLLQR